MLARCLVIEGARRCPHRAARASGDLYACAQHCRRITLLLLDDQYSPATRAALARSPWETAREGQAVIDRLWGVVRPAPATSLPASVPLVPAPIESIVAAVPPPLTEPARTPARRTKARTTTTTATTTATKPTAAPKRRRR